MKSRQEILASRPDLTDEQKASLAAVPTASLETALRCFPPQPTRFSPHADDLDRAMGTQASRPAITRGPGFTTFSALGKVGK